MGKKTNRTIESGLAAFDAAVAKLWKSVAAGDVLSAEVQAAELLALPDLSDDDAVDSQAVIVAELIARGERALDPADQAAFLRLLFALGPKAVKRVAGEGLAELTADGVYPPEWVTRIGKAVPGQACRVRDAFGDREMITVTFSYGDAEHAIAIALDLSELPTVAMTGLTMAPGEFIKNIQERELFDGGVVPITLAEARQRVEAPLARYGLDPDYDIDASSVLALPLVRSRLRRLPAPAPGTPATYTAADRAAAVGEFLASPLAAEAGQPDVARFWAQVLTGYSSRLPDEPPATVGKHRLTAAILRHVPRTFLLSAEQRDGMRQAVTAWTRWAAARQGIDEVNADALVTHVASKLDDFPEVYDDEESAALRGYVADLAAPDADLAWLADQRARRELAVPPPDGRYPGDEGVSVADAAGRAALTEHEFESCAPDHEDRVGGEYMALAKAVVEELWHDDPPSTWQAGKALLATGLGQHDVLHQLVNASGKLR